MQMPLAFPRWAERSDGPEFAASFHIHPDPQCFWSIIEMLTQLLGRCPACGKNTARKMPSKDRNEILTDALMSSITRSFRMNDTPPYTLGR